MFTANHADMFTRSKTVNDVFVEACLCPNLPKCWSCAILAELPVYIRIARGCCWHNEEVCWVGPMGPTFHMGPMQISAVVCRGASEKSGEIFVYSQNRKSTQIICC